MTKMQFHAQRINALDCTDFEQFVAECGGSMPDEYYAEGVDIVAAMQQIWNLAHDFRFRTIRQIYGLSQQSFSDEYAIPKRSIENWDTGLREPPEYLLELLAADVLSNRIPMETHQTRYLPTSDYWDTVFFNASPVCITKQEAERLYKEWYGPCGANYGDNVDFADLWREASSEEIQEFGISE